MGVCMRIPQFGSLTRLLVACSPLARNDTNFTHDQHNQKKTLTSESLNLIPTDPYLGSLNTPTRRPSAILCNVNRITNGMIGSTRLQDGKNVFKKRSFVQLNSSLPKNDLRHTWERFGPVGRCLFLSSGVRECGPTL